MHLTPLGTEAVDEHGNPYVFTPARRVVRSPDNEALLDAYAALHTTTDTPKS
jgi:hypothetical protein